MIALIIYLLLNEYISDVFASSYSVFWAIFYFSNHYIALALISLKARKLSNKKFTPICISLFFGFAIKTVLELTKIGMTFDEYIHSINTVYSHLIFSSVIITSLITISYARKKAHNK